MFGRSRNTEILETVTLDDNCVKNEHTANTFSGVENSESSISDIFSGDLLDWKIFDRWDYKDPKVTYLEQEIVENEFVSDLCFEGVYAMPFLGVKLSIICYKDLEEKALYCIYKSFKSEQSTLVRYFVSGVINSGIVSFMIQLFHDHDWLSWLVLVVQLLFIIYIVARLCILRWAYTRILDKFRRSITKNESITHLAFVRANNFCLELSLKAAINAENDLSYKATVIWIVRALLQLLVILYVIFILIGVLPTTSPTT